MNVLSDGASSWFDTEVADDPGKGLELLPDGPSVADAAEAEVCRVFPHSGESLIDSECRREVGTLLGTFLISISRADSFSVLAKAHTILPMADVPRKV